jgi:DNA-binding LacI/PurR family transcriptional regulator
VAIGIVFDERITALRAVPNLPVVTINHPMAEQGIAAIYANHYQQGWLATRHLLAHGHRDIGFLAIQPDEWGSAERRRGYTDALAAAGVPFDASRAQYTLVTPTYDILTRWRLRGVTALLNFSEDASLETLHILSNVLGLKIGRDISTVSLEDLPVYRYLTPPQTVVRQPLEELAQLAVDHILARAEGSVTEPVSRCLPTELIERDSVATLPGVVPVNLPQEPQEAPHATKSRRARRA